jgi:hypothetical protein
MAERVRAMTANGRITRADHRRFQRDLARTRHDLVRLAPQLPAVQARVLARRSAAYATVLAQLPGAPGSVRTSASLREGLVVGGAAVTGSAALLVPLAPLMEGGLLAGAASAVGITAVQRVRGRRRLAGELAEALRRVDEALPGPDGLDVAGLDAQRRDLVRRALASGRLDQRGAEQLRHIDAHLDDLLVRLVDGDLDAAAAHLTRSTVTRYLPDTLEPLLALRNPGTLVDGRPAAVEVGEQLAALASALAQVVAQPGRNRPETLLLLQRDFLRSKFGESAL